MGEEKSIPPEYRVPLIFIGISVITLVFAIFLFVKNTQSVEPIRFSSDEKVSSESSRMLVIDVSGAVARPGVYTLPMGSRVIDAITIAGGITNDADVEAMAVTINQASILSDGAKVYIPVQGKTTQQGTVSQVLSNKTISVNTASADELDTLSGIGPATAKKIIDNRPYTSLEDLVTKKAMGQSLFDKLKNQLTL